MSSAKEYSDIERTTHSVFTAWGIDEADNEDASTRALTHTQSTEHNYKIYLCECVPDSRESEAIQKYTLHP